MKRFCKDLRENAMKIIDFEKKEMILLSFMKRKKIVTCVKNAVVMIMTMELHSTKSII